MARLGGALRWIGESHVADLARLAETVTRVSERGDGPRLADRAMRVGLAAHLSCALVLNRGCAHLCGRPTLSSNGTVSLDGDIISSSGRPVVDPGERSPG